MNVSIKLQLIDAATAPIKKVASTVAAASKTITDANKKQTAAVNEFTGVAAYGMTGYANSVAKAGRVIDDTHRKSIASTYQAASAMDVLKAKTDAAMQSARAMISQGAVGLGVAGAIVGAAAFPVKEAVEFENAMLGVAKQVAGARDASGNLTPIYHQLGKEIQALGRTIPMSTNELAKMAAAGARMDIPREQLIEFTKTAAMMAEAFELPAAELADQMGKISKLFGLKTQGEVRALADSVNYLDDNAISKGGDIIDFLTRTGGLAGSVKVTGRQMAALGSTLLTLGERSETASTAVNAIFSKFAAAKNGTKPFRDAMAQLHLSLRDVQKGMQVDAQGTLLKVLDKVRALPKDQQMGILTQLVGMEHSDTFAKLANGVAEYHHQIDLANSEGANGSMSKEFDARLKTFTAQWKILKNRTTEFAVNIGTTILPRMNELLGTVGKIVTSFTDWSAKNPAWGSTISDLAKSIGLAAFAFGGLSLGIGGAKLAFNGLKVAMASNPIGILVALLATAAVMIIENWEPIKLFFQGLWVSIGEGVDFVVKKITALGDVWNSMKGDTGGILGKTMTISPPKFGGTSSAPSLGPAAASTPLRGSAAAGVPEALRGTIDVNVNTTDGTAKVSGVRATGVDLAVNSGMGMLL